MGFAAFTPSVPPSPGTGDAPELALDEADFGDGYIQSSPSGLDHIRRVLTLKWETLAPQHAAEIINFLRDHGGYKTFLYTPSDEIEPVKWTCKEWRDERLKNGLRAITATFRQSFILAQ